MHLRIFSPLDGIIQKVVSKNILQCGHQKMFMLCLMSIFIYSSHKSFIDYIFNKKQSLCLLYILLKNKDNYS